jgi:hypothetical protein
MADQNIPAQNDLFGEIQQLLLSKDPQTQQIGVTAMKKFTPEEQQAYSSFANRHRVDTGILGVPSELAIAGAPLAMGAARMVGRAAATPAGGGAIAGGAEGYMRKGWGGVVPGMIEGGIGGGALGKLKSMGGIAGVLGGTAAPAAAEQAAPQLGRLVLTPAEQAAQAQIARMAAQRASQVGMANAAGGSIRNRLLAMLGK